MGFFDSITGFLGDVASEVTHTIAPGLEWTPSSLLKQASKLLPGLAELIPRAGPLINKGISAVETIISGHDTKGPDPTPKIILPSLKEVRTLINGTTTAIEKGSDNLFKTLMETDEELTAHNHEWVLGISNVEESIRRLDRNAKMREDIRSRTAQRQSLVDDYGEFKQGLSQAVHWWNVHVTELHAFISYEGNQRIGRYLGTSQTLHLISNRDDLRKTVLKMQDRMMSDISLPQHLFDLYILTVTWLLTYNKTILTLRSYQAHSKFTMNNRGDMSDYLQIRADWNEDLNTAIRDAKDCANFLLGAPLQEREGFVDRLWNYRKASLCSPTDHHETKDNSSYSFFVDSYPRSAIGSAKFDLAFWDIDRRGLVVIQSGQPNNYSNDKDTVKKLVEALYVGYSGLQSAHFHAATRAAREMAHSWRISADRWQSTAPFSSADYTTVEAQAAPLNDAGKDAMLKRGLSLDDIARGTGYKKAEEVSYAVSYVTDYGEGELVGPQDSFVAKWDDDSFFYLKIKAVVFPSNTIEFPKDDSLAGRREARKFDRSRATHIVRRVYATCNNFTRHLIDISAPPHKDVRVWDLGNFAFEVKEHVNIEREVFTGMSE